MAHAFGAAARVDLVVLRAKKNRAVRALGLAHIAVDAFVRDHQSHDRLRYCGRKEFVTPTIIGAWAITGLARKIDRVMSQVKDNIATAGDPLPLGTAAADLTPAAAAAGYGPLLAHALPA
jgi:hypothetical protein